MLVLYEHVLGVCCALIDLTIDSLFIIFVVCLFYVSVILDLHPDVPPWAKCG